MALTTLVSILATNRNTYLMFREFIEGFTDILYDSRVAPYYCTIW